MGVLLVTKQLQRLPPNFIGPQPGQLVPESTVGAVVEIDPKGANCLYIGLGKRRTPIQTVARVFHQDP